jgi:hypothetical protein
MSHFEIVGDSRPDFGRFVEELREEARWIAIIKADDDTGQAVSDARELRKLAAAVERIGKRQGYL